MLATRRRWMIPHHHRGTDTAQQQEHNPQHNRTSSFNFVRVKASSLILMGTFFLLGILVRPLTEEFSWLLSEERKNHHQRRTVLMEEEGSSSDLLFADSTTLSSLVNDGDNSEDDNHREERPSPVKDDSVIPSAVQLEQGVLLANSLGGGGVATAIADDQAEMVRTPQRQQQQQPRNFSGIYARAFAPWPPAGRLPCFQAETDWKELARQNTPSDRGFLYLKPYKTGSSTTSGINLRIARNVAKRQNQTFELCLSRQDHGPDFTPGYTLFRRRRHGPASFLWTAIREPTKRAISAFFHFYVSREKVEPTDDQFIWKLRNDTHPVKDYYYRALYTESKFDRSKDNPILTANAILKEFNFIGVTERLDESLVALQMLLGLPMSDILYLSAKGKGGYDDGGGSRWGCKYIWPSFVSPGMREYFASDEWKNIVHYDELIYQAVNRSLDLTIDWLGHDKFQANLRKFHRVREIAIKRCLPMAIFPCDAAGRLHEETDCLWKDSGCGTTCLDQVATDLDLW